jgi:hypothetical protein
MAREAGDLAGQLGKGAPAGGSRLVLEAGHELELLGDTLRIPAVGDPRQPFELAVRKAERLSDVPDRAS